MVAFKHVVFVHLVGGEKAMFGIVANNNVDPLVSHSSPLGSIEALSA